MSVHAQVPLGRPGAEAQEMSGLNPHEPPDRRKGPDAIKKNEPGPDFRAAPISQPIPSSPMVAHIADLPQSAAFRRVRTERAEPAAAVPRTPERDAAFPQPLLAEAPASSVLSMAGAVLTNATRDHDSRIRPDSPREPTEVHVHIGRIEVIAAPETPAPKKPRTTAARPTVPLADYLAKKARA